MCNVSDLVKCIDAQIVKPPPFHQEHGEGWTDIYRQV